MVILATKNEIIILSWFSFHYNADLLSVSYHRVLGNSSLHDFPKHYKSITLVFMLKNWNC